MTIVMISSLYQSGSEELAQTLARKTHWPVLGRETILEKARNLGIRIGRLQTAIVKAPQLTEKLAREKNLYLALVTETLCQKGPGRGPDLPRPGRPPPAARGHSETSGGAGRAL